MGNMKRFARLLLISAALSQKLSAQKITLLRDSLMNERMKSGYATKHFRPEGPNDANGQRAGFWKDYEVIEEGSYQEVDGEPMKTVGMYLLYGEGRFEGGKRVGDWIIYVIEDKTDKKILSQKLSYVDGKAEGPFTYFYPNGDKAQEGHYKNGVMEGPVTVYYTGGKIFGEQYYVSGNRHGQQDYFYRSGKPSFSVTYEHGVRNGKFVQWYENGNSKESFTYNQDSLDGVYRYYYADGTLWTEKQYDKGKLLNVVAIYDKNGKELEKGNLKDGNGLVYYYDEEGNVYEKITYKGGVQVKTETLRSAKFR